MKKQLAGLLALLLLVGILAGCSAKADTPDATNPTENTTATVPSEEPTVVPSTEATTAPSEAPTVAPSEEPTAAPTQEPTAEPTVAPSTEAPVTGTTPSGLEIVDPNALTKPEAEFKEKADGTLFAEIVFTQYIKDANGEYQPKVFHYEVARTTKDKVEILYCKDPATGDIIVIELANKVYTAYECRAGKAFRALNPFVTQTELQVHFDLFNTMLDNAVAMPLSKTTILEVNAEMVAPEGIYAGDSVCYTIISTKEVKEDIDGDGKKDTVKVKNTVQGTARVDKATGIVTEYNKMNSDGIVTASYMVKTFSTTFQIPQYK